VECAKILVVDDTADVLEVTAAALRYAGHEVVCCDGSRAALAVLNDGHPIDLLLTDLAMPEIDGFELARRARALRPALLVAYLTAYAPSLPFEALGPILHKPYRPSNLVRRIAALLAEAEDARLVATVAMDMVRRFADAHARASEEEELARLKGDDLSARAWEDIADAILLIG